MALSKGQRVDMISEIAEIMDKREWTDIDLILGQFEFPTSNTWSGNDKHSYVVGMVRDGSDPSLISLHQYLTNKSESGASGTSPWSGDRLSVFLSHLSDHKLMVSKVRDRLAMYGVESFVAHESIAPTNEWQDVIEASLRDCDALVAFLHPGFSESKWCDQEVGWVMGRSRPIMTLCFNTHPHGFLAKYQALKCESKDINTIVDGIFHWLKTNPTLRSALSRSVAYAFADSRSYDSTRKIARILEQLDTFDNEDLDRIELAALQNSQVSDCSIGAETGPTWVRRFIAKHREAATN